MKKKLIILFSVLAVVIAFMVFSFADEYSIEDIFVKQCMTETTAELFEYKDGNLSVSQTVEPLTILKYPENPTETIYGYQCVEVDGNLYYVENKDLKTSKDFKTFCLEKGYLWAHAKANITIYEDKEFKNEAHVKVYSDKDETFVDSDEILSIKENTVVSVVDIFDDSVQIILASGDSGFIPYDYLTFEISKDENFGTLYNAKELRENIVKTALNYKGGRYIWGGTSLEEGVDCSGFTMMIYQKYDVELTHSAEDQYRQSEDISRSELQPGDLVFYNGYKGKGGIGHVAIYIGNDQIVHAQNKKVGITVSNIEYDNPCSYGRIL